MEKHLILHNTITFFLFFVFSNTASSSSCYFRTIQISITKPWIYRDNFKKPILPNLDLHQAIQQPKPLNYYPSQPGNRLMVINDGTDMLQREVVLVNIRRHRTFRTPQFNHPVSHSASTVIMQPVYCRSINRASATAIGWSCPDHILS